jgi:hypothetical protein
MRLRWDAGIPNADSVSADAREGEGGGIGTARWGDDMVHLYMMAVGWRGGEVGTEAPSAHKAWKTPRTGKSGRTDSLLM